MLPIFKKSQKKQPPQKTVQPSAAIYTAFYIDTVYSKDLFPFMI